MLSRVGTDAGWPSTLPEVGASSASECTLAAGSSGAASPRQRRGRRTDAPAGLPQHPESMW
eukprot:8794827-Alexandrium_andersonii.AAC.1